MKRNSNSSICFAVKFKFDLIQFACARFVIQNYLDNPLDLNFFAYFGSSLFSFSLYVRETCCICLN